jgi:hypothetical protein
MVEAMTLAELEEIYMNGLTDDQVGDTDHGPVNHVYRVGRQLVETISTGGKDVFTFDTEAAAIAAMVILHADYAEWLSLPWEDSDA